MTLSQQQGALSNFVSTWNEKDDTTGNTATVTHAAEAGKAHYICGIIVGCSDYGSAQPDSLVCSIKDDSTAIVKFPFTSAGTDDYDPTGAPVVINFTNPLAIPAGKSVTVEVTGAVTNNVAYVNIWGFTDL